MKMKMKVVDFPYNPYKSCFINMLWSWLNVKILVLVLWMILHVLWITQFV